MPHRKYTKPPQKPINAPTKENNQQCLQVCIATHGKKWQVVIVGFKLTRPCSLEPSMIEKIRQIAAIPDQLLDTMSAPERSEVRDCRRWVNDTLIFVMGGGT